MNEERTPLCRVMPGFEPALAGGCPAFYFTRPHKCGLCAIVGLELPKTHVLAQNERLNHEHRRALSCLYLHITHLENQMQGEMIPILC